MEGRNEGRIGGGSLLTFRGERGEKVAKIEEEMERKVPSSFLPSFPPLSPSYAHKKMKVGTRWILPFCVPPSYSFPAKRILQSVHSVFGRNSKLSMSILTKQNISQ